jgi:hypothetical protein
MAAKKKPCKAGKVKRKIKGGKRVCLPRKKAAAPKKRAVPKARRRFRNLPDDLARESMAKIAQQKAVMGPGLYRSFIAAVKRGPCSVSLSAGRLRAMAKTEAARKMLNAEIAYDSKRCDDSID